MAEAIVKEGKIYFYGHARGNPSHAYPLPILKEVLASLGEDQDRAIDVGCGNGFVSDLIAQRDFGSSAWSHRTRDLRSPGAISRRSSFIKAAPYEDLASVLGQFDLTVSLEVVEHLYSPKTFARTLFTLTEPGGVWVVSTPYHGYLKNLALAISGRLPGHLNPLREGGHIKFFSVPQLVALLQGTEFRIRQTHRVGRFPALAKIDRRHGR